MKCAGLIFDESFHYLDHLAPFCALMNWPLIIYEDSVLEACEKFYPQVHCARPSSLPPHLVTCNTRPELHAAFGLLNGYPGKTLWLPHGLSDKGAKGPFFEALAAEDLLLVYGQKMRDTLSAKNLSQPTFSIGNFRSLFYKTHRAFYDQMMNTRFGLSRFILYAPTWEDTEKNGTFWYAFQSLADSVPSSLTLFIKIHPNTQKKFTAELERCKGIANKKNVLILDDFYPIYPLLDRADAYIGDRSSIGYDFLTFRRPLYFLCQEKTEPNAFLMQCGEQIHFTEIPALLSRQDLCAPPQQFLTKIDQVADYAFDRADSFPDELHHLVSSWN